MDTERIEELLRTRPPRERTYDRHLPALVETTPRLNVTVRVRGGSPVRWSAQPFALVLVIVIAAVVVGVWHSAHSAGGGAPTLTPIASVVPTPNVRPGAFSVTGSMTTPRLAATATLLSDGRVLIIGGFPLTGGALASAELYDPTTGTFSPTGSMAGERWYQTATRLPDGRVLIAGGLNAESKGLASAEIFDPATGTFGPTGSMGAARTGQTATLLPDGRVLIAGGEPDADGRAPLATAELYDPVTGKFSPTGSMSVARSGTVATLLLDGRVLIAGGSGGVDGQALSSAELYDPSTGRFSSTGSLTVDRAGATATLLTDGRVLVFGGQGGQGPLSSAELYNPDTGTFGPTGSTAYARTGHSAIRLNDGRVLILGGVQVTNTAELYDPATESFISAGSMASERGGSFTATLLRDGRVLIAGGVVGGDFVASPSAELFEP